MPSLGLIDYRARAFDPAIGRFTQPDSLIPGATNPQAWNRFSYVLNGPVNRNDPTGHYCLEAGEIRGHSHYNLCPEEDNTPLPLEPTAGPVPTAPSPVGTPGPPPASPNYGPGYVGPIPPQVQDTLVNQGADEDLIEGVTLHLMTGSAAESWLCPGNAAVTWFDDIYFCQAGYFDPESPTSTLLHELVHVRQFREGGWPFAAEVQYWIVRTDHTGEDISKVFWAESEGRSCYIEFRAEPTMRLDGPRSLCRLR